MLPLEHSAILSTFIKLPFVIKIFVLSIFELPFYTGFTVVHRLCMFLLLLDSLPTICNKERIKEKVYMNFLLKYHALLV